MGKTRGQKRKYQDFSKRRPNRNNAISNTEQVNVEGKPKNFKNYNYRAGLTGFYATCEGMRNKTCAQEIMSFLMDGDDDDCESELPDLTWLNLKTSQRNVTFVQTEKQDVLKLARKMFSEASKGDPIFRFAHRLLPIQITCHAKDEDMYKAMVKLFTGYVSGFRGKYYILAKSSSNNEVKTRHLADIAMRAMNEVAPKCLPTLNSSTESIILIQVFKGICGLAVVHEPEVFKNDFNIRKIQEVKNPNMKDQIAEDKSEHAEKKMKGDDNDDID